jgi:hypothetical protein
MGNTVIKNPRKIFSQSGGGDIDAIPTNGSDNPVSSDGVYDELQKRVVASVVFTWTNFNPLDSETYYLGVDPSGTVATATTTLSRGVAPITGTIVRATISMRNNTANTNEPTTFFVQVAGGANQQLTNNFVFVNAQAEMSIDSLSIPVTQGESLAAGFTCPAWVTNPTNVRGALILYILPS